MPRTRRRYGRFARSALSALAEAGRLGAPANIIALWRSPERLTNNPVWRGAVKLVDVASFGETGLLAGARGPDGLPLPIPCGAIGAPRGAVGGIMVLEALPTAAGTLALRGPMVPSAAFPPGAEAGPEPHLTADPLGFVDTGYVCRTGRDGQTLTIDGPPRRHYQRRLLPLPAKPA